MKKKLASSSPQSPSSSSSSSIIVGALPTSTSPNTNRKNQLSPVMDVKGTQIERRRRGRGSDSGPCPRPARWGSEHKRRRRRRCCCRCCVGIGRRRRAVAATVVVVVRIGRSTDSAQRHLRKPHGCRGCQRRQLGREKQRERRRLLKCFFWGGARLAEIEFSSSISLHLFNFSHTSRWRGNGVPPPAAVSCLPWGDQEMP